MQLALALMGRPDRREDAAAELRRALAEPGSEPPDWRLHFYLGKLTSDHAEALSESIAAVVTAPVTEQRGPTEAALALLDDRDAASLASGLDSKEMNKLLKITEADAAQPETVKLAIQLLFLRGEIDTARRFMSASVDPQVQHDPVLRVANVVRSALELVDQGDYEAALSQVTGQALPPNEPATAMAYALAFYGLGKLDDALNALGSALATFDTAAVYALVWLRRAAARTGVKQEDAIARAERAASEAVRLDPSRGEGLLLRAQITLEGTRHIESGRRLLVKAMRRLKDKPEQALLWRVQQRVRDDAPFQYVVFEIAAACGRRSELLALRPEQLPLRGMTQFQNGALAELVAQACRDTQRLDDAAEFFQAAVRYYESAEEPDRALEARRALIDIHPTSERSLQLAEHYWVASFRAEERGLEAVTATVGQGLDTLDALDNRIEDQEPTDRIHGAYLRGLFLTRTPQDERSREVRHWALPWLLAAALGNPNHSYRAAHLAWALGDADLYRPALYYADRALDLADNDPWVQQTAIIMRFSWYGTFDPETIRLLDKIDNLPAREAFRAFDALLRDDLPRLRELVDHIDLDTAWAHEVRASVVNHLEGAEAAAPLWRRVLESSLKEEPPDHIAASDAALVLRDVNAARHHIDIGVTEGTITARVGNAAVAVIDLVVGDERMPGHVRDCIHAFERPFYLRDQANVLYPALVQSWADDDEVTGALEKLRKAALTRLAELLSKPLPHLTVELDNDGTSLSDPVLKKLVRELLLIEEKRGEDPAAASEMLRRLAIESAGTPIASTLLDVVKSTTNARTGGSAW